MPTVSRTRTLTGVILAVVAGATPAAAQGVVLDAAVATSTGAVTYQVSAAGGSIPLTLLNVGKETGATVTVGITGFRSEAGEQIQTQLSFEKQRGDRITLPVVLDRFVRCNLEVPPLSGPGPYTGSLIIQTGDGAPVRQVVAIVTSAPARPAVLQVAPSASTKSFTIGMPLVGGSDPPLEALDPSFGPIFDVRLSDAAERWTIDGVGAGPAAVTKAPADLSASENIAFYDAKGSRISFPRDVPARGETLTMQLRNLRAGVYSATIPFHASNAALEPRTFAFTLTVSHHVVWAVLCVSLALLLSFSASKLVEIRNERLRLVRRTEELHPRWLDHEDETVAIVWIWSILTQAENLSRTWLLPSLETVHARLDKAQALLAVIDRLRRVRAEIQAATLPHLAKRRALKIAQRIAQGLDPEMDQGALTEQASDIAALRDWTSADKSIACYARHLAQSVSELIVNVELPAIPEAGRARVEELLNLLKASQPATLDGLDDLEQVYAKVTILWERRRAPEFPELLGAASGPTEQLLEIADNAAWKRLLSSGDLRLANSGGPVGEAHEPLVFTFTSGDETLDQTYLVEHKLLYNWRFEAHGKRDVFVREPTTRVPRVPQFAPFAGTLKPFVTLRFGRESLPVAGKELKIVRSRRFAPVNGFSPGEIIQLFLAFALAIITGLQTFYYKTTGFGTLPDYLALFAWGTAIDQLKNILQRLPAATQSVQGAGQSGSVTTQVTSASQGTATANAQPPQRPPEIPNPQRVQSLNLRND